METKFDDLLTLMGIGYDDLTPEEKAVYEQSLIEIRNLDLGDITDSITSMKYAVELKLCDTPDDESSRDLNSKLKARLKNYVLLEMMLLEPVKRKQILRKQLENIKKS